jgi:putative nucleotidyltransferase with HDIG domain
VSLAARLEREIREGRVELPVLPRAAVEVQELIARDADLPSIVRAIEHEPTVAAALVKYANAAVYAGLRDVTDLQQAVARLGLDQVRETVVSLSAKAAFKADNPAQAKYYGTIWKHSLTTAVAARRLAEFVSAPKETAFLAGLLHDIGRICVLRGITTLRKRDPQGFVLPDNTISEFTDALHCPIGEVLCKAWNIPAELSDAIKRHHDPEPHRAEGHAGGRGAGGGPDGREDRRQPAPGAEPEAGGAPGVRGAAARRREDRHAARRARGRVRVDREVDVEANLRSLTTYNGPSMLRPLLCTSF